MVAVFLLGLLAASITERRAEIASIYNNKKVEISGIEPRSRLWGQNYPREYATWEKTAEMDFRSKYLGNAPEDVLETRPNMVVLWAGYAFARDYKAPRGHWYTIEDMRATLRTAAPGVNGQGDLQPGTCWTCKSPDVVRLIKDLGAAEYYKSDWSRFGPEVVNSVGCADCHDPATMNLTITRPALIEAYQRRGQDIAKATPQEMRSLVCAQCHVEYYWNAEKYLTFPWDKGMTLEDMEAYYDEIGHKDWVHALSKAPMLKAQHPDYELLLYGTHGQRGLSCADCHMPYIAEGGVKYSDHHLMSPLKNVAATCQTCHRDSEANLKAYVYERQSKALEIRDRLETELAKAHIMAKAAWDGGATEEEMAPVLKLIRQSGWRWDYGVASHGGSFHAPIETQRILAHGLDKALSAQLALQQILFNHNITDFTMPDISSKTKAQAFIGLKMEQLTADKAEFLKTVAPRWLAEAQKHERL